ncbi:MAG TPA: potassium transporter Kef, partial [Mycobacterium sp.]|nr:potassium transporter Kef [Mycobacterium sp.]
MGRFSWRRRGLDERLTALPDYELVGVLRIPERHISPTQAISRRAAVALLALLFAVIT